jgi:hypothetical protein
MEKQGGMVFGFRKTATAVIKPDRKIDRNNTNAKNSCYFVQLSDYHLAYRDGCQNMI